MPLEYIAIGLGVLFCLFSCMFAYYAFRYAWFVNKAISRQYMAGGSVLFIVSAMVGFLQMRSTIIGDMGGWVSFSFWITGIIFILVGQIHTARSLQKIYPTPLYQLFLKVKRGGYYLTGLMILLISVPVGALALSYHPLSDFAYHLLITVDMALRTLAVLVLGGTSMMDFRAMAQTTTHEKRTLGPGGLKQDEFSLYQEEIAFVCGYTDMMNYFLAAISPVLDRKILRDLLYEWEIEHPILFENLQHPRMGRIDKKIIGKNLSRIYEKDRLTYLVEEFSALTAHLVRSLSALTTEQLADQTLKSCYEKLKQQYAGQSVLYEVLKSVPDGYLKEEKLTLLSKEELETKVREQTWKLREQKDKLAASLAEKEILLREIHHRVKNNLQIISSLLGLQANAFQDHPAHALFSESRNRIKTMATVHELLYQSESFARIDFGQYIKNLSGYLWRAYQCSRRVTMRLETEPDLALDIDKAVPCGLILNELVSNALKYAFPKGASGEVFIAFRQDSNGEYLLTVSDNGIGFPGDFDIYGYSETLGLRLVIRLVEQLEGRLRFENNSGARFTVIFL